MILNDDLFLSELLNLSSNTQNPVNFVWSAEFIDSDNNVIPVHNVLRLDIASDYVTSVSDVYHITVDMFKSDYMNLLTVNRRMLSIRVTKKQASFTGVIPDHSITTSKMYDVYLSDNTSESVETRIGGLTGTSVDNLGELKQVTAQLVEKGFSEFRNWYCTPSVYSNCSPTSLIQSFLSTPMKSLNQNMKVGFNVTMYPADNKEKFYQRLIPEGILLSEFPKWFQKNRGVYGNGINAYLFNGMWFVYPPYNVMRYPTDKKRLTIVNVPMNEMVGNPNSYYLKPDSDELYIYATGTTKHVDTSDRNINKVGTGFRAVNSNNLLDTFVQKKNGILTIPPGQNSMDVTFDNRPTDTDRINNSRPITGNRYQEASRITKAMTNIVVVNWEYSNIDLLYPAQPLKLLYKYNGVPYVLYGILGGAQTTVVTPQKSITDNRYKSTTTLILITERVTR